MADRVLITQVRSANGRCLRVKRTLQALGLGRIGKKSELPVNAPIAGMVKKVIHLIKIEELTN
jgi:large subunit ribosomal protein L30